MKNKHYVFIIPCIALGLISNAYGLAAVGGGDLVLQSCTETTCPTGTGTTQTTASMQDPYCYGQLVDADTSYWTSKCYKDGDGKIFKFYYCNRCMSGYTLGTTYTNPCNQNTAGSINMEFPKCECSCSNCVTDTTWSAGNTGYQRRTQRTCNCTSGTATCQPQDEYRCAAGYYGSSTNGTSGCTQCPTWANVYTNSARTTLARGTSSGGTSAITGCYIAPGTYYDTTGTFTTESNCKYE